jgi:hypothetical protein
MGAYEIGVACEVKPIHGAGVREVIRVVDQHVTPLVGLGFDDAETRNARRFNYVIALVEVLHEQLDDGGLILGKVYLALVGFLYRISLSYSSLESRPITHWRPLASTKRLSKNIPFRRT